MGKYFIIQVDIAEYWGRKGHTGEYVHTKEKSVDNKILITLAELK